MRRRDYLGSFELMVLLTVMHIGDDAYGVPISEELEAETSHEIAVASVYAALQRLEDKGLVSLPVWRSHPRTRWQGQEVLQGDWQGRPGGPEHPSCPHPPVAQHPATRGRNSMKVAAGLMEFPLYYAIAPSMFFSTILPHLPFFLMASLLGAPSILIGGCRYPKRRQTDGRLVQANGGRSDVTRRPVPTWLLKNLGVDEAVIGDLVEEYQSGRSTRWFYWQALRAIFVALRQHTVLTIVAVALGWLVLWLFFRFADAPLAGLDRELFAAGVMDRYSGAWWLRSALMWGAIGLPFFVSGWMVATVASRTPMLPLLTFALSVSATIFVALILDTGQGNSLDLRMWLTVPLFLTVAPATAIVVGGVVAAKR